VCNENDRRALARSIEQRVEIVGNRATVSLADGGVAGVNARTAVAASARRAGDLVMDERPIERSRGAETALEHHRG
jgi:hypothetical protein